MHARAADKLPELDLAKTESQFQSRHQNAGDNAPNNTHHPAGITHHDRRLHRRLPSVVVYIIKVHRQRLGRQLHYIVFDYSAPSATRNCIRIELVMYTYIY